jgi:hypothetical protein
MELELSGPVQACNGIALPLPVYAPLVSPMPHFISDRKNSMYLDITTEQ